jgi:hypothetical protein
MEEMEGGLRTLVTEKLHQGGLQLALLAGRLALGGIGQGRGSVGRVAGVPGQILEQEGTKSPSGECSCNGLGQGGGARSGTEGTVAG